MLGKAPALDFSIGADKAAGKGKMQGPPRVEAVIDPAEVEAMAKAPYEASMLKVKQGEDEPGRARRSAASPSWSKRGPPARH